MKSERRDGCRMGMAEDAKDPAFLAQAIVLKVETIGLEQPSRLWGHAFCLARRSLSCRLAKKPRLGVAGCGLIRCDCMPVRRDIKARMISRRRICRFLIVRPRSL